MVPSRRDTVVDEPRDWDRPGGNIFALWCGLNGVHRLRAFPDATACRRATFRHLAHIASERHDARTVPNSGGEHSSPVSRWPRDATSPCPRCSAFVLTSSDSMLSSSGATSTWPSMVLLLPFPTMWNLGYWRSGRSPRRRPCHRYTNTGATNLLTSSLACPRAVHLLATSLPRNSSLFRSDESQTRRALRVAGKNERKRLRKRVEAASRDNANDQYRRGGTVALTTTLRTISRSSEQQMLSTVEAGKAHVAQLPPRCRRPRRSRVSIWKWLHHSGAFARDTHLDHGGSVISSSVSLSLSLSLCLSGVVSRD